LFTFENLETDSKEFYLGTETLIWSWDYIAIEVQCFFSSDIKRLLFKWKFTLCTYFCAAFLNEMSIICSHLHSFLFTKYYFVTSRTKRRTQFSCCNFWLSHTTTLLIKLQYFPLILFYYNFGSYLTCNWTNFIRPFIHHN
jgi:hypothetical protein